MRYRSPVGVKLDQHGLNIRVSSRDERGSVSGSDVEGGLVARSGKVGDHLRQHLAVQALYIYNARHLFEKPNLGQSPKKNHLRCPTLETDF